MSESWTACGIQATAPIPTSWEWAARNDRIVLNTMVGFAQERVVTGLPMPGLIVVDNTASIGRIINDLLLIDDATEQAEWANRVEYLPY